ncbi:MAG TPA: GntR family transcriptional regulator [Candidatus Eremiobacteraceae bacterium]|nr:GntR family transcriptional regulator [Candidatus Eremiobacteraceae bacterium]
MLFHLDGTSSIPVYVQLREQVLHAISRGQLVQGDQLPTVREVAVALAINPNTVNRAYADLEREGVLVSKRGRGTFISGGGRSEDDAARATRLKDIARRALGETRAFGFASDELLAAIAHVAREDHGG